MFPSILQADLVSVFPIQIAIWLFGTALIYFLFRYSQGDTAGTDHNPIIFFLASISGEPYDSLSSSDFSF
jgi:hypothetical protein